ncbi:glycosyl hydrolase [Paenibacillus sambharensis]|uniref:Glycosyl hydrolase n=1 Tax=Paenibacillus sambharensis TaxID=1803190 RepID=A0A2W1LBW3_9BACL|nr:stalk domain-containing protein [Paenibacillus sambharensis]PZD96656.1 glycosyl hydrolase [Paenibacillus sambharensis]
MKRACAIVLSTALMFGSSAALANPAATAAPRVSILLDDYALPFPAEPMITQGTTMVPFRAIAEALGIKVTWNQSRQEITATSKRQENAPKVVLTVGSRQAKVNGQPVNLSVAPLTQQGHTLIPLSFFSQQFGAGVGWDQKSRTVSITSPRSDMYTLGFYALSSFDERAMLPELDAAAFGWSRIDKEGNFTISGAEYRWPQAAGSITPESIVQDAAAQGTLPYLMVYSGDSSGELTKNLEDPALQEQTVNSIVDTAVQKGFKGINLDLEGLGWSGDKAKAMSDYNEFVKKLSAKAKANGLKLGVVLHPLNSAYTGYDYAALGKLADELIIMAYEYEGGKKPEPLNKVDEAIRLALKETSKDKLVLGISLDSENAKSVNAKIGLAKRYDLKGIALWRLGIIGQEAWQAMHQAIEFKG